ncbi:MULTISPECIES: PLP-dependent aspartate aminotransferase family protein [unclassified Brevibacterium]|uniref:trans-sulfuration enzyme family protein n=1 Tax=unclassified Brevibacterium TaxID=2614124 RepID=UPI0010F6C92A|nr:MULTISPECIES: PLP-dependent aspartate aminotransferase family protein [unclassified Brevibacterium]MCM1011523.1 PLP-dependent aspartate aminotransferase family protein [Brevibacterium sp. XM4083]
MTTRDPARPTPTFAPETVLVEAARPPRANGASVNPPIELSSTFIGTTEVNDSGYAYGRFATPAWTPFEAALGELEHAALPALVFGSGLAAIAAVLALVPRGGTLVMPTHSYQGSLQSAQELAARAGFSVVSVDIADTDAVIAALDGIVTDDAAAAAGDSSGDVTEDPGAASAMLWIESPTNPMLEVADMPALIAAARARGVRVAVDNTFATPLLQTPLDLGADLVVHSVTKYLAGHSDVVLGAVITNDPTLRELLLTERSMRGAIAGPFEVWLALRGMRTLSVRLERAQANAQILAERLSDRAGVVEVRYPGLPADPGHARASKQMAGFGAIVAFTVDTAEQATAIAEAVRLWTPATSLGGVESLIERRRRHASEPSSVPEGLLRLSVGIEHVDDLWADLDAAITAATGETGDGEPAATLA